MTVQKDIGEKVLHYRIKSLWRNLLLLGKNSIRYIYWWFQLILIRISIFDITN